MIRSVMFTLCTLAVEASAAAHATTTYRQFLGP